MGRRLTRHNWREWPSVKQSLIHNDKSIFKSKNEWYLATLLDFLDIVWEYEPSTFLLPSGESYTPDFWLPEVGAYIEAKSGSKAERLHKPYELQKMFFDQVNCDLDPSQSELVSEPNENGIQMIYTASEPESWKMLKVYVCWDGQLSYAQCGPAELAMYGPDSFWGMCAGCDHWYPVSHCDTYTCRSCGTWFSGTFKSRLTVRPTDRHTGWNEVYWSDIACYAHTGPDEITNLKSHERLPGV